MCFQDKSSYNYSFNTPLKGTGHIVFDADPVGVGDSMTVSDTSRTTQLNLQNLHG